MFKTFIHAPDISPHKVTQPTNFCTLQNMKNTAVQPLMHREKNPLAQIKIHDWQTTELSTIICIVLYLLSPVFAQNFIFPWWEKISINKKTVLWRYHKMRQTQITRINSGVLLSKFLMNLKYAFSISSNILCQDYIQIIHYKDQHFQAHLIKSENDFNVIPYG